MITAERLREVMHFDHATGAFTWRTGRYAGKSAGCLSSKGYRQIKIDQHSYEGHRLAWLYVHGEWPAGDLDHRNRDRADNRLTNLRPADDSQNQANASRPPNKSGFRGVAFFKGGWMAQIKVRGRTIYLGTFMAPEEASAAYQAAARQHFGEFAACQISTEPLLGSQTA